MTRAQNPGRAKLSNRQRRLFALAAVGLGLCAAVLIAEAALRVYVALRGWTPNCYITGLVFFVPDNAAGHTLRPNLRLKSSTYDISVNSLGFRGPEIKVAKAPDTIRIAVLGGSSVFGYLVPEGQDSCRVLEGLLKSKGEQAEVINAGVPGFNMYQSAARYKSQVSPLDPDYVVLYLGWNDIAYLVRPDAKADASLAPPAPPQWERILSRSVLYGLLAYRLFPADAPQFAPPHDADRRITEKGAAAFRKNLDRLVRAIQSDGAVPIISTQLMAADKDCVGLDSYLGNSAEQVAANRVIGQWVTDQIREAARRHDLLLIDVAARVPCDKEMLGDAIHLTKAGHAAVSAVWADEMMPLLNVSESARSPEPGSGGLLRPARGALAPR